RPVSSVCSISARVPRSLLIHSSWPGSNASPGPPPGSSLWPPSESPYGPASAGASPAGGSSLARSSSGFRSSSSSTKVVRSRLDNCSSLIACISCGVMTSDCDCRNSNLCVSAMKQEPIPKSWSDFCLSYSQTDVHGLTNGKKGLEAEFLAKVKPANVGIGVDLIRAPLRQDFTGIDDVGAIGE